MLDKLKSDELILHKIGLMLGALAGFIFGLFISNEADKYEIAEVEDAETTTED